MHLILNPHCLKGEGVCRINEINIRFTKSENNINYINHQIVPRKIFFVKEMLKCKNNLLN